MLTVSGAIGATNAGDTAVYDLDMLMNAGRSEIRTSTIWTDDIVTFAGVPLSKLLDQLGVSSGTLWLSAANEYIIELPVEDVKPDAPIIAYEMNGAPMSRREKGPLWVIYPYDRDPMYQTELIYARSVWQLDMIEAQD